MHVEPPCEKALLRLIEPGVPAAGETDIAAFAPAPPRLLAAGVTNLRSAQEAGTPSTPADVSSSSVKHSKQEAGNRPGKILKVHHAALSRR
jgi:hypothetical protein